ncbi:MAG: O-methyltransferase [Bacteroidia bacterium]|nr:MAG: O-methyltransferase [Bacteroidia bacterium]
MKIIPQEIQTYVENNTDKEPSLLFELNKETHQKTMFPRMISGNYQGRLLSFLSKLVQPKYILEVGTYTGYASLCLAEGLQKDGKVVTIEVDPELEIYSQKYFNLSDLGNVIEQKIGDAIDIIPSLEYEFDLIFLDADKMRYIDYYEILLPKLRSGGLLITDNVLWSGQVVDPRFNDKTTTALREFNQHVANDERVDKIILPVRDGLFLIRKK